MPLLIESARPDASSFHEFLHYVTREVLLSSLADKRMFVRGDYWAGKKRRYHRQRFGRLGARSLLSLSAGRFRPECEGPI